MRFCTGFQSLTKFDGPFQKNNINKEKIIQDNMSRHFPGEEIQKTRIKR